VPILLPFTYKEVAKETVQVVIARFFLKCQTASIIEEHAELRWASRVKIESRTHLQLENFVVFLLAGCSPNGMPGKRSAQEIKKDVGERLNVITA
jgi:hypothetical protein